MIDDANHAFMGGISSFNTPAFSYSSVGKALTGGNGYPLIVDLDGNGVNEIVVYDNANIRLYSGSGLSVVDAISTTASTKPLFFAKDYDSDGKTEILYLGTGFGNLLVYQYNGTSIVLERTIALTTGTAGTGDKWVGCSDTTNRCVVVFSTADCSDASTGRGLSAQAFNSTTAGTALSIESPVVNQVECSSAIPVLSLGDNNNDAFEDVIFNYYYVYGSTDQVRQRILRLSPDNLTLYARVANNNVALEVGQPAGGASKCCSVLKIENYFSSPMTYDFDASPSNGKEIVDAYLVAANNVKVYSYNKNYAVIDDYPEIAEVNGEYLGNVVRGDFYSDSDNDAFCVVGYDKTLAKVNLVCGSLTTGNAPTSIRYIKTGWLLPLDTGFGSFNLLTQTIKAVSVLEDGKDLDELITGWGVLDPQFTTCQNNILFAGYGNCLLDFVFSTPKTNTTLRSVDAEKVGREDIVGVTPTNVWYLDDEFVNAAPEIGDYEVNPCITSTWKINTTAAVSIEVIDAESDNVRAKALFYAGTPQQINTGWTAFYGSGTTIPLSVVANVTTASGILRLIVGDSELNNNSYDLAYSVANNGVVFGDCVTNGNLITPTTTPTANDTEVNPADDNAIASLLRDANASTGLGLGVLWLLFMLIVAVAVFMGGSNTGIGHLIPLILFLEGIMLVVGTMLGFISPAVIVVVSIMGVVIVGFYIRSLVTGG